MANNRKKFLCLDCGVDTGKISEHYFVNLDLWLSAVGSKNGMLCIRCLEKRIGRELTPDDFTNASINSPKHESKSALLMQRMGFNN